MFEAEAIAFVSEEDRFVLEPILLESQMVRVEPRPIRLGHQNALLESSNDRFVSEEELLESKSILLGPEDVLLESSKDRFASEEMALEPSND